MTHLADLFEGRLTCCGCLVEDGHAAWCWPFKAVAEPVVETRATYTRAHRLTFEEWERIEDQHGY